MASNSFKNPPEMRDDLLYDDWKRELSIWENFTDLDNKRQGSAVFLSLKGKARETVLAEVDVSKLNSVDGVKHVTEALDKLFGKNKAESAFTSFENFIKFKRPMNMSIKDYTIEFNLKLKKVESHDMTLPSGVLAYYLLECANLSPEQTSLCRATCSKLTYHDMKEQIERVSLVSESSKSSSNVNVEYMARTPGCNTNYDYMYDDSYYAAPCETDDVHNDDVKESAYYVQPGRSQYSRGRGAFGNNMPRKNRLDEFGNPTHCRFCKSICHWVDKCPHAPESVRNAVVSRGTRGVGYRGNRGSGGGSRGRGRGQWRGGVSTQYQF